MSATVRQTATTLARQYAGRFGVPLERVAVTFLDDDRAAVQAEGLPPWTTSGPAPSWMKTSSRVATLDCVMAGSVVTTLPGEEP
jgi:hypothetical protein